VPLEELRLNKKDLQLLSEVLMTLIENYNEITKKYNNLGKYSLDDILVTYVKVVSFINKDLFKELIRERLAQILKELRRNPRIKPTNIIVYDIKSNLGNYIIHGEYKVNGEAKTFLIKLNKDLEPTKFELL